MSYLIIPVKEGSSSNSETDVMFPAFVMHFISAIILSVYATSRVAPDLHGWARFGLCTVAVVIFVVLSMLPKIGAVLSVANAIVWILALWAVFGGISFVWLKWGLRVFTTFLIVAFEGMAVMNSLE